MKRMTLIALVLSIFAMPLFATGQTEEGGKKVVYWSMWNEAEPQGQVIARAAEAFQEKTGVEVDVVFNGREIRKILAPAIDAGDTIDIFDEDVDRVSNSWGKYLLPLGSYVSATYETTKGQPFETQINQTLVKLAQTLGNGEMKIVPYQPFLFTVLYNKDLFKKAGISSRPENWTEFEDVCAKLKAAGITPITVDDAYMAAFFGYNMSRLIGVDATLKMVEDNDFSNPAVLKFAEIWSDFAKKGYMSPKAASNIWPAGQVEEIAKGKAAMYLNGTWLPNEIKGSAPNLNWGAFAWPSMGKEGNGVEATNYGGQCFGINKDSKVAEEAFRFIVFMTTGEWDTALASESIGIPMGNESEWPSQLAEAKVVLDNTSIRMPWACGMENSAEISVKIKENFAKLIAGSITPQEFYDNMNK